MRLEELILRIPGDEFQVRFHEHLTVLSGIGLLERQALADSVMGALTGGAENAVVTAILQPSLAFTKNRSEIPESSFGPYSTR